MVSEKIDTPVPVHTSPSVSPATSLNYDVDGLSSNVFQRTSHDGQFGMSVEGEMFLDIDKFSWMTQTAV